MYYAYILRSLKNGKLYIGSTGDLVKRLARHNSGGNVYTRKFRPFKLLWSGNYKDRSGAVKMERKLKSWKNRATVERFVKQNCVGGGVVNRT